MWWSSCSGAIARAIQLSKRGVLDVLAAARPPSPPPNRRTFNNATGRGLVCQYDVVCFDEVSGVSFDQKDGVNILKGLLSPSADAPVSDEDLEWAVRLGLEVCRRVKEQQKRIGSVEFRNTHFSYTLGAEGVEKFVATPELTSENSIGADPLEPGQVWALSPGGPDEYPGLYWVEVNEGPGSGLRILNKPTPAPFQESTRYAQQNLYARATRLVGDRDPRAHEFSVQLRSFDAARSGSQVGVAALIALCSSLLKNPLRGGLVVIGEINLGGSIEPIHNAVTLVEMAIEKGAQAVLMPVTSRRQLFDLSDDMATRVDTQFYQDARDALLKALVE